jgi:Fe-S-cluster containining protein
MSDKTKLQALYDAIPAFECRPNCGDCCGPVPMAKAEWEPIKQVQRHTKPDCMTCMYLVDSKCSVYEHRPFLCRIYGASWEAKLLCPHGCGPDKPLTKQQTTILMLRYTKIMGKEPTAWTVDIPLEKQ